MERKWELCFGRDQCGTLHAARVPYGVAKPGMMVRLVGGVFLLVEELTEWMEEKDGEISAAAEILTPVWGRELLA